MRWGKFGEMVALSGAMGWSIGVSATWLHGWPGFPFWGWVPFGLLVLIALVRFFAVLVVMGRIVLGEDVDDDEWDDLR